MHDASDPYDSVMGDRVELRQLRCLAAIVEAGSFTDAAIALGVSQAAVSRTLAGLERELGVRLLRRTSRRVVLTAVGRRVLTRARRVLAEADALVHEVRTGHGAVRVGYAWSAVGRHTVPFQRLWAERHPGTELTLVRINSPTAGLAEGECDVAVVRIPPDAGRFENAVVGLEARWCAMASDDPWARRRSIRLAEIARRTVLVDVRTGTTGPALWPEGGRPADLVHTTDVDDWLDGIAAGRGVGVTAEATSAHYPRPGIRYRPIRDAPPIAVRLAWWRDDPHPATRDVLDLLVELYRQ